MRTPRPLRSRVIDPRFDGYLQRGIAAAKAGDRDEARSQLERATELNQSDPRPWLWLASTTDDPQEKREYLECALAADPANTAARRGLVLLSDQLDKSRLVPEGASVAPRRPTAAEEAQAQTFKCRHCGGRLAFDTQKGDLVCGHCGQVQAVEETPAGEDVELVLDFVLPTTRAHRWAEAQQRVSCQHCAAVTLLPPGQKTTACPFCGSDQLLDSAEAAELVDPQAIALLKIDAREASRRVKRWLGRGFFAPDDLGQLARRARLRPAYYPFWAFNGTLEVKWACEVNAGSLGHEQWVPRSGSEFVFFDDVLAPGIKALTPQELAAIEPFELQELVAFKPEYLAGWPALSYDRPLAAASLLAREKVMGEARRKVRPRIEPTHEKRRLNISPGNWTGTTFKHVLLPLWVGTYRYKGTEYHLLVNGQTGQVGGAKPRDPVKVALVWIGVALVVAFVLFGLLWTWRGFLFGIG